MNSSNLSAAATAASNPAAAGPASVDALTAQATTDFQSLIQELPPDEVEQSLTAGESSNAGNATAAPAQSANPDLATAQLLLQLPPLLPTIQPSSNAAPQLLGVDSSATMAGDGTHVPLQAAGVFATLQTESDGANDQSGPANGLRGNHVAAERSGNDGTSAWLTDSVLPTALFGLHEPADRSASTQNHQGERGSHAPAPQSLPPVAAAVAAAAASARDLPTQSRIDNPVGTTAWRQELANTVNLMIDRGEQSATLRLSPEHLGPLEVRIAIREGETSLWFGAAHADTRQALEQALPRLREQFANAGLSLGQSSVSQESPREPRNLRAAMISGVNAASRDSGELSAPTGSVTTRVSGLIDTYV